ncbi:DUF4139 domain-containing protein [Sphingorhabdus arenilitoris]|uniref:DUF4139 domain-containing protein n=1 Tax=Sphingorhabdus arenilitoris TaxID=1490041 RepID=A0ABV8RGR9_9SPHN
MRCLIFLLCSLYVAFGSAAGLKAQTVPSKHIVVAPEPTARTVTIYRSARTRENDFLEFDPENEEPLKGFAMITETRTINLPPGQVTVRFEGVASGIIPQSAILMKADSWKEKNFDSRLLSQRGLLDAYTGQLVSIRVTDDKTGEIREEQATILSQPDRLILKTGRGYEAVNCSDGVGTILFPGVPVDLTAKPTLSMTTRPDNKGGKMTVTLAYLANNFDWQADYVATFSPDGQSLRLFGWMTIASKDRTSFPKVELSAVAGTTARAELSDHDADALEREKENDPYSSDNIDISFECWPQGTTGRAPYLANLASPSIADTNEIFNIQRRGDDGYGGGDDEVIVVTGTRRVERTDLGDLKLYTIPFSTDVLAQSMKQVRFLEPRQLKGETLFKIPHYGNGADNPQLIFRFENRRANGGGESLPQGQVGLFQLGSQGRQLLGQSVLQDKSIGEDVEIKLPSGDDYKIGSDTDTITTGHGWADKEMTVKNNGSDSVLIEVEFEVRNYNYARFSNSVFKRKGKHIWRVKLEPNSSAQLRYRLTDKPEEEEAEVW